MNYGAGNLTNKGPDGGIDGIIDEDELGLSKIYIQAKRYKDGTKYMKFAKSTPTFLRKIIFKILSHKALLRIFIASCCLGSFRSCFIYLLKNKFKSLLTPK